MYWGKLMTVTIEKLKCQFCMKDSFIGIVEKKDIFKILVCENCRTVSVVSHTKKTTTRIT